MEVIDLTKYNYRDKDSSEFIKNVLNKINGYLPKIETIRENTSNVEIIFQNEQNDKIRVIYKCFKKKENLNLENTINEIDISFTYIKDFQDICGNNNTKELKYIENLKAYFTFVDGGMKFQYVNFRGDSLDFERAIFINKGICFFNSTFESKIINFDNVKSIKSNIWFSNSKFNNVNLDAKLINLIDSDFKIKNSTFKKGSINFLFANSYNSEIALLSINIDETKLDFYGSTLHKVSLSRLTLKSECNLQFDSLNILEFKNCNIQTDISLDGTVEYKRLYFDTVINNGKIFIDWNNNNVFNAIENIENYVNENQNLPMRFIYERKLKQYRLLKNNFNNIGYHEDEDKALVQYMDNYLLSKGDTFSKFKKHLGHNIGGYGTNPFSIIIWTFFVICIFSILYFISGLANSTINNFYYISIDIEILNNFFKGHILLPSIIDSINRFGNCFYFSGITFLTIGYGDITPHGFLLKTLTVLEGSMGILLMSYLSVSIIRKILR